MTRRQALLLPLRALALAGNGWPAEQNRGMVSRGVKALQRGKPSGLPFHARFVNVARQAGLLSPVIYGEAGRTDYIVEGAAPPSSITIMTAGWTWCC
jgi:hypothetical protein